MAETKPTASAVSKSSTSVQPIKKSNSISWVAPVACIIAGYVIWRFVLGAPGNFNQPDPAGGFWPKHQGPKSGMVRMYEGGIIVPLLLATFFTVVVFVIERLLTIGKATGSGNI